jgi:hypothetical protein
MSGIRNCFMGVFADPVWTRVSTWGKPPPPVWGGFEGMDEKEKKNV